MAESPAPTYTTERLEGMTLWTCIIPDASSDSGICGHKTTDEGYMFQHMCQRHNGQFIKAPDEPEASEEPESSPSSATQPETVARSQPSPIPEQKPEIRIEPESQSPESSESPQSEEGTA
jgi:hypothetical protein